MLSRRQFLQAAGIAVAAAHLPRLEPLPTAAPSFDAVYGRALVTTPIYAAPNTAAPLIKQLWSDTVVTIDEIDGDWYRLRRGYARRENIQPMNAPAQVSEITATPPFWGEVSSAIAVVRAWCSAAAPILARVGHGGVLRVIDSLSGGGSDSINWYGVAADEASDLLGWVIAAVILPVQVDEAIPTLSLIVQTEQQRMDVYEANHLLLSAPISTGRDLPAGSYLITARCANDLQVSDHLGAPWALTFADGHTLSGAYWHNRFGTAVPGAAIQVAPLLAKWLYPRAAEVIIS
jgi:hypothetical protein